MTKSIKGKLPKFGLNRRRFVRGVALSAAALGTFSSLRGDLAENLI